MSNPRAAKSLSRSSTIGPPWQQPVDALGIERGHHRRHVGKVGDGGQPGTAGCDAGELHPLRAVHTSAPVVIIVIIAPPGYVTTTTPWTNCTVTYSGC